jgi:hypothetical protein
MPSTLRTAGARVIGACFELGSEYASLLAPGAALQLVRGSPQSVIDLAAAKIQRFVVGERSPQRGEDAVPAAPGGPGDREPEL